MNAFWIFGAVMLIIFLLVARNGVLIYSDNEASDDSNLDSGSDSSDSSGGDTGGDGGGGD